MPTIVAELNLQHLSPYSTYCYVDMVLISQIEIGAHTISWTDPWSLTFAFSLMDGAAAFKKNGVDKVNMNA